MRHHVLKLDALRGLASQPVVISHAAAMVYEPSVGMAVVGWCAHLSVIFFFALSGYAIIGGLREEASATGTINLPDYVIRRIARIYPPYIFTIAIVTTYYFVFPDPAYEAGSAAILRALTFLFMGGDSITVTPVWSLRIEVVLYAIAGLTSFALATRTIWKPACLAAATVLTVIMCWKLSFGFTGLLSFATGCLIYWAVGNKSFGNESRLWSAFVPLGAWSYTLYLIHMPIILTTMTAMKDSELAPALKVFVAVIAANVFAALAARLVERPKEFATSIRRLMPTKSVQSLR